MTARRIRVHRIRQHHLSDAVKLLLEKVARSQQLDGIGIEPFIAAQPLECRTNRRQLPQRNLAVQSKVLVAEVESQHGNAEKQRNYAQQQVTATTQSRRIPF